jgi:hypothetical protein
VPSSDEIAVARETVDAVEELAGAAFDPPIDAGGERRRVSGTGTGSGEGRGHRDGRALLLDGLLERRYRLRDLACRIVDQPIEASREVCARSEGLRFGFETVLLAREEEVGLDLEDLREAASTATWHLPAVAVPITPVRVGP